MTSAEATQTLGQAVEVGLVRLKTVWRRHEWTPNLIDEYRRVLRRIGSAEGIGKAIDAVIEQTEVNYPPPPGAFARIGSELAARAAASATRPASRSLDESALIDALAFLDRVRGTDDEEWAEGMVRSIRKRLPDFGGAAEERHGKGVQFVRAEPYRHDPPGTVRFAVRQPGRAGSQGAGDDPDELFGRGEEPFPRGPLNGGR